MLHLPHLLNSANAWPDERLSIPSRLYTIRTTATTRTALIYRVIQQHKKNSCMQSDKRKKII